MSSYMLKRQGNFYFRIWVPQDLQQFFPYPEIKRSLRTRNPQQAKQQVRLWSSKAEQVFMVLRANIVAPEQVQEFIRRELPSTWQRSSKPSANLPVKQDTEKKSKQLEQMIEAYMQEHITLGKWTEKTIVEARAQLALFLKVAGNVLLKNIDRQTMVGYLEVLKKLPAGISNRPAYRGKTLEEIIVMPDVLPMSTTTVNKYLERAGAMLLWCMRQGYIDRNPARGLSIAKATSEDELRLAYGLEDIVQIKKSLAHVDESKPERYWIARIGMYSGMRINEICQLYVEDVVRVEGVWSFDINDEKDKRIKNLASKRILPVHPRLVELGFLDYVEKLRVHGCERLWSNLLHGRDGHSHAFSHWYQRHNRKHVTSDPKKCFHSFRHTVADTLKQAGVAEGVIAEILGHANHSITTGRYGKRYRPQILLEALEKLNY